MNKTNNNSQTGGADRQADERLIHALLLHIHDDQAAEHREQRVHRAMQAVRDSAGREVASTTARRLPAWARRTAWATAATVLVVAGALVLMYRPTSAMASLNDIIVALGRPGDRAYRISMEELPEPPGRRPYDDNTPEAVPRPSLNDATLCLRDGRQYLLVRHDPNGGQIFDGYDGRQSWRIRDGLLAETKEGPGAGGIPMPPMMADVPFSDLHQTLERIRVDYTVERLDQESLSSGGEVLRHVGVRRNSREVKGPETIDIWADPKTAIPKHIIFDRAKLQGSRVPCRLTFDLLSEEPLPADWFSPAPHAGAGIDRKP